SSLDCILAVCGGVADRLGSWCLDIRETLLKRLYDASSVIHGKGRLRHKTERCIRWRNEAQSILDGFHQGDCAFFKLAHGANDFWMARVADQDDMTAKSPVTHRLLVNLGDERTGRIQIEE